MPLPAGLSPGSYAVVATYSGSTNFELSTSQPAALTVNYGVCPLYDSTKPAKLGSTIPIKLQLCARSGANVSSSAIVLHATVVVRSDGAVATPEDSGKADPGGNFRLDGAPGGTGGYIFNLQTKNLSIGTWSLHFTIAGQGDYTAQLEVR
jgi:hypothetical protein